MKHTKRNWLTISEAASQLGISRQRMHQLVQAHGLAIQRITPQLHAIDAKELTRLEKLRKSSATAIDGRQGRQ